MAFPEPSSRFQTGSSNWKRGIGSRKSPPATSSLHRTVQRIDKTMKKSTVNVFRDRYEDPSQQHKRRVTSDFYDERSSKPTKLVLVVRNLEDTNQQNRSINKEREIREDPMKRVRERRRLEIEQKQRFEKERAEKLRREEEERLVKERLANERLQEERKASRLALEKMEREADVDDYYHTMTELAVFGVYDRNCLVPGMKETLAKERLRKERKALRMALEKMERDADVDNNLQTMRDLATFGVAADADGKYPVAVRDLLGFVLKQDIQDNDENVSLTKASMLIWRTGENFDAEL